MVSLRRRTADQANQGVKLTQARFEDTCWTDLRGAGHPFDVLKVDRAFVQDATRHVRGASLLRAMIRFGALREASGFQKARKTPTMR